MRTADARLPEKRACCIPGHGKRPHGTSDRDPPRHIVTRSLGHAPLEGIVHPLVSDRTTAHPTSVLPRAVGRRPMRGVM
jgi:hypothetical protein